MRRGREFLDTCYRLTSSEDVREFYDARAKGVYRRLHEVDLNDPATLPPAGYDAAVSVGAFSCAHIKVDALAHSLALVRPGGLFVVCINERALDDMGFAREFERLAAAGEAETLALEEDDYHLNAGIRGWICSLRRCAERA